MKHGSKAVEIRAVVFQEGDWWSAQCLEYDVAAQAQSVAELRLEIERVLTAYVVLARRERREAFEGMRRAPERFWKMYERARAVPNAQPEDPRPDSIHAIIPHLRILEEAQRNA